jgi:RHH-type proline utilization regulon transcriptional repressor/proline dehydrogenase/delta 1-pyrroline-5-carboxylate dehydrogenase
LEAAAASDAYWWGAEFGIDHDPAALFCEANVFRYRPLPHVTIRVGPQATPLAVIRVLLAALTAKTDAAVSLDPTATAVRDVARAVPGVVVLTETSEELAARLGTVPSARVRLVGADRISLGGLEPAVHVDDRPPVLLGRLEVLRYLREQTVSRTLHRFGNVVEAPDA